MPYTRSECRALLRGQQRSKRYRYRDALPAVALDLGIPESWLHYWIGQSRLKARPWLGETWVRREDVEAIFQDHDSVVDAFWATCDPVTSPITASLLLAKWPWLPKRMCQAAKAA